MGKKGKGSRGGDFAGIYEKYQKAIALVVVTLEDKEGRTLSVPEATAFAVSSTEFVTNAHVAYAVKNERQTFENWLFYHCLSDDAKKDGTSVDDYLRKIGDRGVDRLKREIRSKGIKVRSIELRLNHSRGKVFNVRKVQVHSLYKAGSNEGEFDLAKFTIDGRTDTYFLLGKGDEITQLKAGQEVASAGFPLEGLDHDYNLNAPEATFSTGIVKKVTDFHNRDAGPEYNRSITHTIPIAGGSSGSPIFDRGGKVIAVLWGGSMAAYTDDGKRIGSTAMQNYAVRIDQLDNMTRPVSWNEWLNQ